MWIEGISSPCATPTATRAAMVAATLSAVPGVSRHAVDHIAKDAMSVRRPPHRWAAQPPGTCNGTVHQKLHVLLKPIAPVQRWSLRLFATCRASAGTPSSTAQTAPCVRRPPSRWPAQPPGACKGARQNFFPDHGHARSGGRRLVGRPSAWGCQRRAAQPRTCRHGLWLC